MKFMFTQSAVEPRSDPGSGVTVNLKGSRRIASRGWSHSSPGQVTLLDNTQGPGMSAALRGSEGPELVAFVGTGPVLREATS